MISRRYSVKLLRSVLTKVSGADHCIYIFILKSIDMFKIISLIHFEAFIVITYCPLVSKYIYVDMYHRTNRCIRI